MAGELVRPSEFARRVGCSRGRVSQLLAEGRLPTVQAGRLRLIPWEEGRLCWALHRATADGGPPPGGKRPRAGAPLDPGAVVDLTNWDPDRDWWEPVDLGPGP